MTVDVEMLARDSALVITTPSLLRRILFGERTGPRVAVRLTLIRGGVRWVYEDSGRVVSSAVLAAIEEADFFKRFTAHLVRLATDPPPN